MEGLTDEALNALITKAMTREQELQEQGNALALQNKEFANYLKAKKHLDEEMEVLWGMVKQEMIDRGISEHDTDFIKLKLTPSGKFKADNIEELPDEFCDIKKTVNNRKIKAYQEMHGKLPDGVQPTGYVLRKTLKDVN